MAKSFSMSTPRSFFGRSLMCPTLAKTSYSPPKYLEIVFALEGYSTINSGLIILIPYNLKFS